VAVRHARPVLGRDQPHDFLNGESENGQNEAGLKVAHSTEGVLPNGISWNQSSKWQKVKSVMSCPMPRGPCPPPGF
jgi:hypothetical protein